jgi:hypothetical protein
VRATRKVLAVRDTAGQASSGTGQFLELSAVYSALSAGIRLAWLNDPPAPSILPNGRFRRGNPIGQGPYLADR